MRRNVISWLVDQVPSARHALVLTHNISFLFVQGVLSARLRAAGNPRLTIFADADCAASAWRQDRALLDGLGVRYRVVPVDLGPWRRFHPKALLLASPDRAALALGSGNLTWGGVSANHESWTFGVSDGEGAPLIAAFRDYMGALLPRLPLAEPLRDAVDALFEPGQAWVANLPAAAGLVGTPSAIPLLDQIAGRVDGPIREVRVLAPYHDDDGAALTEIAKRWPVPVTCWMQAGREGLSRGAAANLPPNVMLRSIDVLAPCQPSFIHAKMLAFYRDADVVLAVGSANCSRAALLADESWGNAELMALDVVSHAEAEALFDELARTDNAPALPERPPSEDWLEPEASALRILAARQAAGMLEIAFRSELPLAGITVQAPEGTWPAEVALGRNVARAVVPMRLRTVRLAGKTPTGEQIASADIWVDDEASLAAPATLRRMLNRMSEPSQADPAQAFRGVLEIFRDYLRDPEAARRRMRRPINEEGPSRPYDPAEVFADDFGTAGVPTPRGAHNRHEPASILAIVEALFSVSREVGAAPPPPPPPVDEEAQGDDDSQGTEPVPLPSLQPRREPDDRTRAQLRRALKAVEAALMDEGFVSARTPELLGADLALAALLLVKGLADGLLDPQDYRETTRRLWTAIFFGEQGMPGRLSARLAMMTSVEKETFIAAITSPRLSAALTLWSMTEWAAKDANALAFRLSAARLYLTHRWLFATGPADVLLKEITGQAEALLSSNEQVIAGRAWVELVRAGEALRLLSQTMKACPAAELFGLVSADWLDPSDVVWVAGQLAIPVRRVRRDASANIEIRVLGETITRKFRGSHIVPVRELIAGNILGLPPTACCMILRLLGGPS